MDDALCNNNNLRLLQLQSNRAIIQYQHSSRRARNNSRHAGQHYTEGLSTAKLLPHYLVSIHQMARPTYIR